MDTVIEQGLDWELEYNTEIKNVEASITCVIEKRSEPWIIVAKPKASMDCYGVVRLQLTAKETKQIPYIPAEVKWDSYAYSVYMLNNDTKHRILYGGVYIIPNFKNKK